MASDEGDEFAQSMVRTGERVGIELLRHMMAMRGLSRDDRARQENIERAVNEAGAEGEALGEDAGETELGTRYERMLVPVGAEAEKVLKALGEAGLEWYTSVADIDAQEPSRAAYCRGGGELADSVAKAAQEASEGAVEGFVEVFLPYRDDGRLSRAVARVAAPVAERAARRVSEAARFGGPDEADAQIRGLIERYSPQEAAARMAAIRAMGENAKLVPAVEFDPLSPDNLLVDFETRSWDEKGTVFSERLDALGIPYDARAMSGNVMRFAVDPTHARPVKEAVDLLCDGSVRGVTLERFGGYAALEEAARVFENPATLCQFRTSGAQELADAVATLDYYDIDYDVSGDLVENEAVVTVTAEEIAEKGHVLPKALAEMGRGAGPAERHEARRRPDRAKRNESQSAKSRARREARRKADIDRDRRECERSAAARQRADRERSRSQSRSK